jgi:hypothetical protein
METQLTEKPSDSSPPAPPGGSSSPLSGRPVTWAVALVVVSAMAMTAFLEVRIVEAYIHGTAEESARAWKAGLALLVPVVATLMPAKVTETLLAFAGRLLPGGGSKT